MEVFCTGGVMTNRRKALCAVAAVITLLMVAAISILRSRQVAQSVSFSTGLGAEQQGAGGGGGGDKIALYAQLAAPDKKLIHNAELELVVGDVRAGAEQIRKLVDLNHGEIDKLEIRDATGGSVSATLVVRVPASGLENTLAEFKKVGCEPNANRSAHAMFPVISMTTKRTCATYVQKSSSIF